MASLDVKTAFDLAKPSMASTITSLTRLHGHVEAALEEWRFQCICIVESRGKVEDQGWEPAFGGKLDDECLFRGMRWADNYWQFSDDKEKVMCIVFCVVEELLELDMESKPESSTPTEEDVSTMKVESTEKIWDMPFMEVFDVMGHRFLRDGKGAQGPEKTLTKGLGVGGVTGKCHRVVGHVFITALNGSVQWPWSVARTTKYASHFGSSHFLFERAYDFLRHELFWFCLVQVSTTQFCSHLLPWRVLTMDQTCQSPVQLTSSNFGSPNGSGPDLDGMGITHMMHCSKSSETRWYHSCGDSQTSKIMSRASVTPWVSSHPGLPMWNRSSVPLLPGWSHSQRWNRTSVPSLHECAKLKQMSPLPQMFPARQDLGHHSNRLMVLQPQGPMAQTHRTTTGRRRLDTISNPDDEIARSAILLQFPCEQLHAGVSTWLKKVPYNTRTRYACQDSL